MQRVCCLGLFFFFFLLSIRQKIVRDPLNFFFSNVFSIQVEKIAAHDQPPKVDESDILKELFVSDVNSPTGIM